MKNKFEIRGEITAIFLHKKDGTVLEVLIDTNDLPKADSFPMTWYAKLNTDKQGFYVAGNGPTVNGRRKHIKFHRFLIDAPDELVVDFANHDTLDCRRLNLRAVTQAENMQNLDGTYDTNTSGFRGVSWSKNKKKWQTYIQVNRTNIHLGYFDDYEAAKSISLEARQKLMPFSKEHAQANLW